MWTETATAPRLSSAETTPLRIAPNRPFIPSETLEDEGGNNRVLRYLQYRWLLILVLGGMLGAGFGAAAWKLVPSKYTTVASVRVSVDAPALYSSENPRDRNDFVTYLKTQGDMMRSQVVLLAAMRDPDVSSAKMLREQVDPIRFLEEELKIETKDGSEIIKLMLTGDDPQAIAKIVNAVQRAFFREVVEDELKRKKARLLLLEDRIQQMQSEVKKKYGTLAIGEPTKKLDDPLEAMSSQMMAAEVVRLNQSLAAMESDLKAWQAKKEVTSKKLLDPAKTISMPVGIMDVIEKEPKIQQQTRNIEQLQTKMEYLIKTLGNTPDSEAVQVRQRALESAKESREKLKEEKLEEWKRSQETVVKSKLENDMEEITATIEILELRREEVKKLGEKYQKMLISPLGPDQKPVDFARVDIQERESIIKGMIDKSNLLRLEVNAPARVRPFQTAAVPLKKEMKKQIMATLIAVMMGFACVGGFVILSESRKQRVLSLQDVRELPNARVLGVIPEQGTSGELDIEFIEAIDRIRYDFTLLFERDAHATVAFASAMEQEGQAFVAWSLAERFALAGESVLLIDFDLRDSQLHTFAGIENIEGISQCLLGKADPEQVKVLENGIHLLTAGEWTEAIRSKLTSQNLEETLSKLAKPYRWVLLNLHPLLPVAETMAIANTAQAAILCVEKEKTCLPHLRKAQEKLLSTSIQIQGMIYLGASSDECLT
jgi:polysaccharide biosynthesis transport protein